MKSTMSHGCSWRVCRVVAALRVESTSCAVLGVSRASQPEPARAKPSFIPPDKKTGTDLDKVTRYDMGEGERPLESLRPGFTPGFA